jgi:hypothetical protein
VLDFSKRRGLDEEKVISGFLHAPARVVRPVLNVLCRMRRARRPLDAEIPASG